MPKNIKECPETHRCPVVLKCKKEGIYTRMGTEKCPCRDWMKK